MTETEKRSHSKAKAAGIIIGVVFVVIIVIFIIAYVSQNMFQSGTAPFVPATVYVSGTVQTVGSGTQPVLINFVDQDSGTRYSDVVSGGNYGLELPNGARNYNVQVGWEGLAGSTGTCDAGTANYFTQADGQEVFNFRC